MTAADVLGATAAALDPRLTPARPGLAAESLRGRVAAPRYAAPERWRVIRAAAPLRAAPGARGLASELVWGAEVDVYEIADGLAWAQAAADGYVGYLPADALGAPGPAPTHRVAAPTSHLYPAPEVKTAPLCRLPMGARLAGRLVGTWLETADGFVPAPHVAPLDRPAPDWVAAAERLTGAPYLWGGGTAAGLDCSALIQVAMDAAGRACPRDSDMQAALGAPAPEGDLRRGDLAFWRGHVGVMLDAATLLHANAHHMAVAAEPLAGAVARIAAAGGGAPVAWRRPFPD